MGFLSPVLRLEVHLGSTGIILLTAGRMDLGLTPHHAPATASLVAPKGDPVQEQHPTNTSPAPTNQLWLCHERAATSEMLSGQPEPGWG